MKWRNALALALLGLGGPAWAAEPLKLSIEEALQRAEAGSESVSAAKAVVDRADAEKRRARADLFPQVSASANYERALTSEYEGLSFPGASAQQQQGRSGQQGGTAQQQQQQQQQQQAAANPFSSLPFGQVNTWRLNLNATQLLYAGGRVSAARHMAAAGRDAAAVSVAQAKAQAALDAVQAYFDAVLTDKLLGIARASLEQAEKVLQQVQTNRQAGNAPEFDVLRARVSVDNQKAVIVQRDSDRTIAFQRLRQLLDLPPEQEVQLTTGLDVAEGGEPTPVAEAARQHAEVGATADERLAVRQMQATVRQRESAVDLARAGHKPTLSLYSNLGRNAYPDSVVPAWGDFKTNWTVGVMLNLPIFQGFKVSAAVDAARADLNQAQAQLRMVQELSQLDRQIATSQLDSARAAWASTEGSVEQAQRASELAELRYAQGVSTQLEVSDARLALEQARALRARAARDLQVAKVRLALLPALALGGAPQAANVYAPAASGGSTSAAQQGAAR
jgi:outer membrane protein TolC